MSDALRGFVLLLSIVLWLPALRPFLDGQLGADQAALRYAGALLLSWGGVSLLATIVRTYTPKPEQEPAPAEKPTVTPTAPAPSPAPSPSYPPPVDASDGQDASTNLMPDGSPQRRAEDAAR